jgi:ABC-2 type transport system ATP-binding protein/lipopolysaccharide transport system ATP-binding protein
MKVTAGIYKPTSGLVDIKGDVTPVLAAGIGLEDEISVLDNIKLALALRNTDPNRVVELTEKILDFCELSGSSVYKQFRHLSTGYKSRLAFAIATVEKPTILVLDEVLGGGDAAFMVKAGLRLRAVIEESEIAFIATHSPEDMQDTCNRLIYMENGKITFDGNFKDGLTTYRLKLGI